jgi:hypothetical protein
MFRKIASIFAVVVLMSSMLFTMAFFGGGGGYSAGDDAVLGSVSATDITATGTVDLSAASVSLGTISSTDWVDSADYAAGSIDTEHIANDQVTMDKIDDDGDFTDLTGDWATTGTLNGLAKVVSVGNCEGVEDGGTDNQGIILTDSGESLTVDAYIGMTLYNITDGSSCTITDNDGTTITCSGGLSDSGIWEDGDVWQVGPGPKQSGSLFFISTATTIAHPATAGYTAGYYAVAAQVIKIDPYSGSMTLNFDDDGTFTDPGAGDEIDGDGTQGDFIFFINASATEAYSLGVNGSWADGGAS